MMKQVMACMTADYVQQFWLLLSLLLYLFFGPFISILSWTLFGAHISFLKYFGAFLLSFIFCLIPA